MSYAQAGQYQGAVTTLSGASVPRASVNVYLVGTTTRASLFTDATMATAAPNPAVADGAGNLGFYAAPGLYDLAYAGTTVTVEVSPNPADLQASLNAAVQKAANLSDVNAATARTNLGLGTAATQPATAFATSTTVSAQIATQATVDAGAYVTVVEHGATASTARPTGAIRVFWRGTVAPTNAVQYDRWINTTSAPYVESSFNGTTWDVFGSGTYAPKWQPLTIFAAGALVAYQGVTYQSKLAHTSGTAFNPANWDAVADAPSLADLVGTTRPTARNVIARLSELVKHRYGPSSAYIPLSPNTDVLSARGNLTHTVSPWVIDQTIVVTGAWIDVTTAGNAGSTFRPTIHADNGFGYPGQLIIDMGPLAADAIGRPVATCNVTLPPGVYHLGGVVQGATTTAPTLSSTTSSWTPPIPMKVGTTAVPASRASNVGYNVLAPASGPVATAFATPVLLASNNARVGIFTGAAPKIPTAPLRWRIQGPAVNAPVGTDGKISGFFPTSCRTVADGGDGYCYGYFSGLGVARLARTHDGGQTFELGPEFAGSLPGGYQIIWVGSLWNGTQWLYNFVASSGNNVSGGTGRIYNCRTFTGSYGGRLVNSHTFNDLACGRPVRHSNGKDIMIVGEYVAAVVPSSALDLWMSNDGGDTWTSIRQSTPIDTNTNSHWHTTAIDETTFRVWASSGDGANSWFGYTDNILGGPPTWTAVPLATTDPLNDGVSNYVQPTTLCLFTGSSLHGGPDRSSFAAGLWRHDLVTGLPKPAFRLDAGVSASTSDMFPRGPFVQTVDTAIIAFPDKTLNAVPYVWFIGTGDRGASWHDLGRVSLSGPDTGARPIVGPDAAGYVYWKSLGAPTPYSDNLLVAPLPTFA